MHQRLFANVLRLWRPMPLAVAAVVRGNLGWPVTAANARGSNGLAPLSLQLLDLETRPLHNAVYPVTVTPPLLARLRHGYPLSLIYARRQLQARVRQQRHDVLH